ncbi:methyltransferase domain-containing protein [Saccharopolyspora erythraea]|nr:methyltransferase domain-containing protein [Saccharopolyspora erythraea]
MPDARAGAGSRVRRSVRRSARQLRAEAVGRAVLREKLLEGLRGRVIEIGAGQGLNFIHYPPDVAELRAVEPDDVLRDFAAGAAKVARIPVDVVAGEATALPVADASQDAAVVSLLLCTVPSPDRVLAEVRRCLRPGGELRFYEHVRAPGHVAPYVQDAATPVWMRCFRGCHPNRDAESAIRRAGFDIVEVEHFNVGTPPLNPAAPHILGRAIRA